MPRGKKLTKEEQGKILALTEEGYGEKLISRRLGRSKCVVSNFLKVSS